MFPESLYTDPWCIPGSYKTLFYPHTYTPFTKLLERYLNIFRYHRNPNSHFLHCISSSTILTGLIGYKKIKQNWNTCFHPAKTIKLQDLGKGSLIDITIATEKTSQSINVQLLYSLQPLYSLCYLLSIVLINKPIIPFTKIMMGFHI